MEEVRWGCSLLEMRAFGAYTIISRYSILFRFSTYVRLEDILGII